MAKKEQIRQSRMSSVLDRLWSKVSGITERINELTDIYEASRQKHIEETGEERPYLISKKFLPTDFLDQIKQLDDSILKYLRQTKNAEYLGDNKMVEWARLAIASLRGERGRSLKLYRFS